MWEIYLMGFLGPLLVLASPVVIATWKGWKWTVIDPLALAVPGALWLYLIAVYGGAGRSLSNLVELPFLAILTAVLAWLKGPLQRRLPQSFWRYLLPIGTVVLSLTWYYFFPALEE